MADTNNSAKINIAVDLIPGDTKELAKVVNTFKNELTSGVDLSKYFKYLTKSYTKAIGSLSKPQSTVDKYINGVAIKTAYENMQKINDLRTAAGNKCDLTSKIQKTDKQNAKNTPRKRKKSNFEGCFKSILKKSFMKFKLTNVYIQKQTQRIIPCQFRSQDTPAE